MYAVGKADRRKDVSVRKLAALLIKLRLTVSPLAFYSSPIAEDMFATQVSEKGLLRRLCSEYAQRKG